MHKINTVTVVGAGYMGGGIAQVLALNGFDVQIADVSADATKDALTRLDKEAREFEEQGLFEPGSAKTIMGNLTAADSIDDAVSNVDFVMEAVFEDPDVKKDVLASSTCPSASQNQMCSLCCGVIACMKPVLTMVAPNAGARSMRR